MSTNRPTGGPTVQPTPSLDGVQLPLNLAGMVKAMRNDNAACAYIKERAAPYQTPITPDVLLTVVG